MQAHGANPWACEKRLREAAHVVGGLPAAADMFHDTDVREVRAADVLPRIAPDIRVLHLHAEAIRRADLVYNHAVVPPIAVKDVRLAGLQLCKAGDLERVMLRLPGRPLHSGLSHVGLLSAEYRIK